ncbi:hypothetical protein KPATCC21470_2714 [Kitasatospora purpeofusca]
MRRGACHRLPGALPPLRAPGRCAGARRRPAGGPGSGRRSGRGARCGCRRRVRPAGRPAARGATSALWRATAESTAPARSPVVRARASTVFPAATLPPARSSTAADSRSSTRCTASAVASGSGWSGDPGGAGPGRAAAVGTRCAGGRRPSRPVGRASARAAAARRSPRRWPRRTRQSAPSVGRWAVLGRGSRPRAGAAAWPVRCRRRSRPLPGLPGCCGRAPGPQVLGEVGDGGGGVQLEHRAEHRLPGVPGGTPVAPAAGERLRRQGSRRGARVRPHVPVGREQGRDRCGPPRPPAVTAVRRSPGAARGPRTAW